MKCDVCGIESEFEKAFKKVHRSLHRSDLMLCPHCLKQRRQTSEARYQVAMIVGGIVGYIVLWFNPGSVVARILTAILLFDIFLTLSIIPHELGHAIAGRLVGWRVFAIVVGTGKRAFKFNKYGILFRFHWLPTGGATFLAPVDAQWFRTKKIITVLAGPTVNVLIATAIAGNWWNPWHEVGFYWGVPRWARICFIANLFILAINLWPHRVKTFNADSDGKQLIKALSNKQKRLQKSLAARYTLEAVIRRDEYKDFQGAMDWCNRGLALYPKDFQLLNLSGALCLYVHDYKRAREIFLQLLPNEIKPGSKRYVILNNIAYADALTGDPALMAEADAYSKEAYGGAPWMRQFQEGIKLLHESIEKHDELRTKALNACHLAIAYARMGDRNQADNYLKLARQFDAECVLIERAERELNV
jgi:Flp pilus assembly protein TadD